MKGKVRKPTGHQGNEWSMMPTPVTCTAPIVGFPRSAFEAVHDESTKFRQLPCRTHISVGVCPYREKCVFLHDPRCCSATAKSITRLKNKNKDDCIADSLYWPAMPRSMVMQYPEHGDKNRPKNPYQPFEEEQPHSVQPYCVPVPQQDQYHLHDAAVYSMWMHFVDFCLANASPCHHPDTAMCYAAVDVAVNPYTRSNRLSIFRTLCNGQSASSTNATGSNASNTLLTSARSTMSSSPATVLSGASPQLSGLMPGSTSTAPPALPLSRRHSTSPVSIINTSTLEFDESLLPLNFDGELDLSAGLRLEDCGVNMRMNMLRPSNTVSPVQHALF